VLLIREIDLDKSVNIVAIRADKEVPEHNIKKCSFQSAIEKIWTGCPSFRGDCSSTAYIQSCTRECYPTHIRETGNTWHEARNITVPATSRVFHNMRRASGKEN
jgi:hypothetical protein